MLIFSSATQSMMMQFVQSQDEFMYIFHLYFTLVKSIQL